MADTKSLKSAFEIGREAHLKGDNSAARNAYVAVLADQPDHDEVLHALGNLEMEEKRLDEAEKHLRKAISLNRYGVGYQSSLGNLLVLQKQFREAESAYFEELRMRPDYAAAHNQLGNLLMRTGNIHRAIKHYRSALQFSPKFAIAANNLGRACMLDNQFDEAEDAYALAIRLEPKFDEAHANLGVLKFHKNESVAAADHFEKALTLNPDCGSAIRGIGLLRIAQGKVQEAIAAFSKALEIDPEDVESVHALANIWHRQGVWDEADKFYLRARQLAPNNVDILNQYAELQLKQGNTELATQSYEMALQIRPSDQISLAGYGRLKAASGDTKLALSKLSSVVQSGRAGTDLLGAYASLLGTADRGREGIALLEQRLRTKVPEEEKCRLHFTLGELLDNDSSYDLAFYHYRKANELKKAVFDQDKFEQYCSRIIQQFTRESLSAAPRSEHSGENLTFLVGMPRSGVRVIEQLLGNQKAVTLSGSTPFIEMTAYRISSEHGLIWPQDIEKLTARSLSEYARLYIERIAMREHHQSNVVDATWRNFLYLGLIEMLFPKARVVYCSRDYRDIALSCFFRNFTSQAGMSFAYNTRDIAAFINQHKKVMANWMSSITLPVHVVSYERMILDFEDEYAALRRFMGILDQSKPGGDKAKEKIPKPSFLKSTSLRRYRHYRKHLEVFLEDLRDRAGSAILSATKVFPGRS